MESNAGQVYPARKNENPQAGKALKKALRGQWAFRLLTLGLVLLLWHLAARSIQSDLLLPSPWSTAKAFFIGIQDLEILENLFLTLKRVLYGLGIALVAGTTLGFLMGYSKAAYRLIDPVIGPIRQVPIMAWVPLTIIWLGLGDGPTLFIIAIVGVFPILLNTISGVQSISPNYINAARSMGARPWGLFSRVILPASLPDILTGVRLAVSAGWMSVIWAEFIATSAGFGFSMVNAQQRMETPLLIALMFMAAMVGYGLDKLIAMSIKKQIAWKYH